MDEKCIFCQIIEGQTPAQIIHQDEEMVAFKDINPKAPVHILIVPRHHIASVSDLKEEDKELVGQMILTGQLLATKLGVDKVGYRLVFNTGPHAGQVIDHIHLHLLGGGPLGSIG